MLDIFDSGTAGRPGFVSKVVWLHFFFNQANSFPLIATEIQHVLQRNRKRKREGSEFKTLPVNPLHPPDVKQTLWDENLTPPKFRETSPITATGDNRLTI